MSYLGEKAASGRVERRASCGYAYGEEFFPTQRGLSSVSSQGVLRSYVPGEVIFEQGDAGQVMYFLREGRVKITQTVRGKEKTLAILEKGSFFGELSVFTYRRRSATAQALDYCKLVEVDSEQLDHFLVEHPEVARRMIGVLAQRLRETDDLLENMRHEDADSRVSSALLQIAEEQGSLLSHVDVYLSVDQLAVKTTLPVEELKRILTKLKKFGFIQITDGRIHIPSLDLLRGYHAYLGAREERAAEPQVE